MGLRFRKSINMGPFRLNLSKSGVGYSVGGKGFRFTKKANGGYRTTLYLPGTGISHVEDTKKVNENNELSYPNIDPFTLKKDKKDASLFLLF